MLDTHQSGDAMLGNYIGLQKKPVRAQHFETITAEYDAKQAEFNKFREQTRKKGEDALKQELEAQKNKFETLKRTLKVDLTHAKMHAQQLAKELLQSRISKCKQACQKEFEELAIQYQNMRAEVMMMHDERKENKNRIIQL